MGRAISVLAVAAVGPLAAPASSAAAGYGRVARAPLTLAEWGETAVTGMNGGIYVFGGSVPSQSTFTGDSFVYRPAKNRWSAIARMALPVTQAAAALEADHRIYVVGGYNQGPRNWVQAYDPATNTWACSQSAPGCVSAALAPLPVGRDQLAAVTGPDGTIWALGGFASSGPVSEVDVYDTAGHRWLTGPTLPQPLSGLSADVAPTGAIDVVGGYDTSARYVNRNLSITRPDSVTSGDRVPASPSGIVDP